MEITTLLQPYYVTFVVEFFIRNSYVLFSLSLSVACYVFLRRVRRARGKIGLAELAIGELIFNGVNLVARQSYPRFLAINDFEMKNPTIIRERLTSNFDAANFVVFYARTTSDFLPVKYDRHVLPINVQKFDVFNEG